MSLSDNSFATDGVDEGHDANAWRAVGAWFVRSRVDSVSWDLQDALADVAEKVEDGEPLTAADIDAIREAKDELVRLTEDHLTHLADDVEPWDRGVGHCVPYGVLKRQADREQEFPSEPWYRTEEDVNDV